jgi:hypothetical protein
MSEIASLKLNLLGESLNDWIKALRGLIGGLNARAETKKLNQ